MKDQCYQFIKGPNDKITIAGFGSYGQVKIARNIQTGEKVAIKMIYNKNAKDQIDVHHKLNHPKIIRLLNYYYEKEKNITYMVLEYAEGGTLYERIKFGYGLLPKDKVKKYFKDICKAVQYLHSLNYMHRDIKPENILLTKNDHAKLCDFGFAAILQYRSTLCGTYQYMAPEMIQQKPYDYRIDIWALGILLYQLINGTAPFKGNNGQDVINQMKKNIGFSNRFQKQQIDLVKKILRVNAENRPSVSEILASPYLKDVPDDDQYNNIRVGSSLSSQSTTSNQSLNSSTNAVYHHQPYYQKTRERDRQQKQRQEQQRLHIDTLIQDKLSIPSLKNQKQKQIQKQRSIKTQPSLPINDTKQFKHYVPQGVKTPIKQNSGVSHGFNNSQNGLSNPNTSVDSNHTSSSYRQPQMQMQNSQNPSYSTGTGVGIANNSQNSANFHHGHQQGQAQRIAVNPSNRVGYAPQTHTYGSTAIGQVHSRAPGISTNVPTSTIPVTGTRSNLPKGISQTDTEQKNSGITNSSNNRLNNSANTNSNLNANSLANNNTLGTTSANSNVNAYTKFTPISYRKN